MGIIKAFICHCYGNKTCNNFDKLRYSLFRTSINNSIRDLPSSKIGIFYHVLRSCFQAGCVWGNTFLQEKTSHVSEFGWDKVTGTLQIKYIDEFNQKTLHDVLETCKCSIFFLICFMINKDIKNYIDLLPRYFPLSILVVVYISSKFCLMIIIHSKKRSPFFPRGLYNDISH